jgi:hypothetical protein
MKAKKNAKPMSATLKALVASATTIGMDVANGYGRAVELFRKIGAKNRAALQLAATNYKHGYVAVYLKDRYAKRWGNMTPEMMLDEVRAIYAKPYPESSKSNRRTELEHKACRAADVSVSTAKRRAGLVAEKKGGRKPQPARKATSTKAVPVDLVKASPTLKDKPAANDYFATACAALLATVNKNAKKIDPRISSAVSDFHSAMKAAGFITAAA